MADNKDFLRILVDPPGAELDIVFIHGLDPTNTKDHAAKTWTAGNTLWPRDLLSQNTELPPARILLFGYNANVAFGPSSSGIRGHAEKLLASLDLKRSVWYLFACSKQSRPLLFVCHSLGGLMIKRALVIAKGTKIYEAIRNATWGLVFFGTPHRGGNHVSLGKFIAATMRGVIGGSSNTLLQNLEKDGFTAEELAQDFRQEVEKYQIVSCYETKTTKILGGLKDIGVVVEHNSAVFGLSIDREKTLSLDANHSDMCKFASREVGNYELVEGMIVRLAEHAVAAGKEAVKRAEQLHVKVEQIQIFNITHNHSM